MPGCPDCSNCYVNRERLRGTFVNGKCHIFRRGNLDVLPCLEIGFTPEAMEERQMAALMRIFDFCARTAEGHPEIFLPLPALQR